MPIMSHFQSLSAYRRSQPVRVTPPLHREIHENDLILGAKQLIASQFLSGRGKTGVNTRRIHEDFDEEQAEIYRYKPIGVQLSSS